jgi:hypothetical protein
LKTENPAAIALMAKMGVEPKDRAKARAACIRLLVGLDLPEKKLQPIMRFKQVWWTEAAMQDQALKAFDQSVKEFN